MLGILNPTMVIYFCLCKAPKANAQAYSVANNVTKISNVFNHHPSIFNPNSAQEEIMDMACCMSVTTSDDEWFHNGLVSYVTLCLPHDTGQPPTPQPPFNYTTPLIFHTENAL
jgi:hypothetical protein